MPLVPRRSLIPDDVDQLLRIRRTIYRQQRCQVGQVHVAVAIQVAVFVRRSAGRAVVGKQSGQVAKVTAALVRALCAVNGYGQVIP